MVGANLKSKPCSKTFQISSSVSVKFYRIVFPGVCDHPYFVRSSTLFLCRHGPVDDSAVHRRLLLHLRGVLDGHRGMLAPLSGQRWNYSCSHALRLWVVEEVLEMFRKPKCLSYLFHQNNTNSAYCSGFVLCCVIYLINLHTWKNWDRRKTQVYTFGEEYQPLYQF